MERSERIALGRADCLEDNPDERRADELLRTILASVGPGVFATDEAGTVVFANPGMADVLGYAPDELAGQPLSTFVPERFAKYHALTDVLREEAGADLEEATFDVPAVHSDGDRLWLSVSFATRAYGETDLLVGTVHSARDRTEREAVPSRHEASGSPGQQPERPAGDEQSPERPAGDEQPTGPGRDEHGRDPDRGAREAELARYERIIETIDDGIYVLDEEFLIRNVNEAVVSMTGYSREELLGSHASLLASDDLIQQAAELSAEMLAEERETATIVSEIVRKNGDRVPIETRFSLYSLGDERYGQLGVVRDISDRKQFEQTLGALHNSTRDLLAADSKDEVSRLIVDTATAVLDLAGAVIYLVDPDEHVLRPTASSEGASGFADAWSPLESADSLPWRVFVEGETAVIGGGGGGAEGGQGSDTDPDWRASAGLPVESGLCVPLGDHGVFVAATADRPVDGDTERLVGLLAASAEEALSRVDREIDVRERDRRLEARNRRLRQLDRVNAIIREIGQSIVEAESVDAIGEAVCDRLAAADRFAFAWFGETTPSEGTIVPRSWSGGEPDYLDDVEFSLDEPREPAARAAAVRELTVVTDVGAALGDGQWRKAALSRGYQSVIAIPLTHGDITHGVLTVYADEAGAFDDMETVFAELGETIANAMNAVETRRALLTDSHTELGFRVDADDDVLQQFARRAGGPIDVEGVVPQADDATRIFFTASGTAPEAVRTVQEESVVVEAVTLVAQREEHALFEAVVTGETVLTAVADRGARIRTATATDDEISLDVEIPDEADVRQFVADVQSHHDGVELVSKTSRDRPLRTRTEFQYEFEERLTDRQMEVLRVAYLRGFYEWPRESTGQEVADALGVSQPTVNRHLRTCERKLFTMLFEEQ